MLEDGADDGVDRGGRYTGFSPDNWGWDASQEEAPLTMWMRQLEEGAPMQEEEVPTIVQRREIPSDQFLYELVFPRQAAA